MVSHETFRAREVVNNSTPLSFSIVATPGYQGGLASLGAADFQNNEAGKELSRQVAVS